MRRVRPLALALVAATLSAAGAAVPAVAAAQSLLYRPPNLSGTWVPAGGVLQFNFLHRFALAPAPTHKVNNFPTLVFALGLGHDLAVGTHYATNSFTVRTTPRPNEIELFARLRLGVDEGKPGVSVSLTPAYNFAARSVDGELGLDVTTGPFTLSAAARGFQKPFGTAGAGAGAAGGLSFRLNEFVALGGDVGAMLGEDSSVAWSAGISVVIPGSPHTFSLHASNSKSTTLQGASFAPDFASGKVTYGFEFTIPIHFNRFAPWFSRRERAIPVNGPFMNAAAQIAVREYRFAADSVVINAGQSIGWTNHDDVAHTVTFDAGEVAGSGELAANGSFVATFARPGVYRYHCTPHPMMKGVVVVR